MNDLIVSAMLLGAVGTNGSGLPYWMTTNQYDLMPQNSGAVAVVQAKKLYDPEKTVQWQAGVSLAANSDPKFIVDECYGSVKWKVLSLDLGIKHRPNDFLAADPRLGSLSVTGGHLIETGNARSLPGYCINLDPWAIPGTKEHLIFYGAFGDYRTIDNRYVQGAWVHRTRLFMELQFGKFQFHMGLDHFAQWNGVHPKYGQMPNTFGDYLRVITGASGGSASSQSDQMNVIGNQGGAEMFKFVWNDDTWTLTFQHDIPYEDKSGMLFHNFPDGVNTLHFGFKNKDRWVSDILYEFQYTMYQSGSQHDPETYPSGEPRPWQPGLNYTGGDNYFNNGEYASGWTHFGRTYGNPLFFPKGTHDGTWNYPDKIVLGVENNRLWSHHIGLSGKLFKRHPYKLMLTYSMNYGRYQAPYAGEDAWGKPWGTVNETGLWQFSAGFSGHIAEPFKLKGFSITYGIFGDKGQVLRDNLGFSLGVCYSLNVLKK